MIASLGSHVKARAHREPRDHAPAPHKQMGAPKGLTKGDLLLKLEDDARAVERVSELHHLAANASAKLARACQVFIFEIDKPVRVRAISGFSEVDRSSLVISNVEEIVSELARTHGLDQPCRINLAQLNVVDEAFARGYAYGKMYWLPFRVRSEPAIGGVLLARDAAWSDDDITTAKRVGRVIAHAKDLLLSRPGYARHLLHRMARKKRLLAAALLCTACALVIPVPMTTLSPFEVVPRNSFLTTAPIEGVVDAVHVQPGERVKKGQLLVQLDDIVLRNRLDVAERELLVAEARLKKATQLAFDDRRGRHELRLAMADQALKTAQRDYARDMLARASIRSDVAGTAIFADRHSLVGKPVTVGERIMRIAESSSVDIAIDVAVGDATVLERGAKAKLYFAHSPLRARDAKVAYADYRARKRESGQLAYQVTAHLVDEDGTAKPRIGSRGTAKLYGSNVPLAFYLFRRPLAVARQWFGL